MIRKHVDLIAIALLLGGIALYSHARTCVALQANRLGAIRFTTYRSHRQPVVVVPALPYARD